MVRAGGKLPAGFLWWGSSDVQVLSKKSMHELYRPGNKTLPVLSTLLSQESSLPGQFIIWKLKVVPSS